jgi:hypothetical protein
MNTSDLRKIKLIAQRLHARESDVFRFAIKSTLAKLAPMHELHAAGTDLMPIFMEFGPELAKYFELDTPRLDRIINDGVNDPRKRVDLGDIELLVLAGIEERYAYLKLRELGQQPARENGGMSAMLRDYLLAKYAHGPVAANS